MHSFLSLHWQLQLCLAVSYFVSCYKNIVIDNAIYHH